MKDQEKLFKQYLFYRLYSIDLNGVRYSLSILKRYKRKDVRYLLLKEIVVSYSRPFSGNRGESHKKHSLSKTIVPAGLRNLHDELIKVRNQLFAHTDLTYRNPKVANWSTDVRKWFPMSFRAYNFKNLDNKAPAIEILVKAVEANLQRKIEKIEETL